MVIVRRHGKYCLLSKKTHRNLGCYRTRAGAERREGQVAYFKSHPRRRVGTVDGVEIHKGTPIDELGVWTGTYIEEADRRILERDPNTATFVLREGDRVDALLIARVDPLGPEGKQAGIILLESTHKGAGSKMVRAFEQWAKEIEVDAIYLTSAPGARGFWVRMGYDFVNDDDAIKLRSEL